MEVRDCSFLERVSQQVSLVASWSQAGRQMVEHPAL